MPDVGAYLQPNNSGVFLKSYQHASRLYLDGLYGLAPKASWMYYVVFDINPAAITDPSWLSKQHTTEVGMLVKSADLPKFSLQTETVNQYNRKTVIQKGITYNPVSIALHDDQNNTTHNLWLNYYRYYFADANNGIATQLANGAGALASSAISGALGGFGGAAGGLAGSIAGGIAGNGVSGLITGLAAGGKGGFSPGSQYGNNNNLYGATDYGLNSPLTRAPFFRTITIYQMNRHLFTSFQLVNPLLSSWDHDKVDQTQSKFAESRMNVAYETVFYGQGQVKKDNPTGFAVFHYDNDPSPLGVGNQNSLPGALLGAIDLFGDVTGTGNTGNNPINTLNAAVLGAGLLAGQANLLGGNNAFSIGGALGGLAQTGLSKLGINLNLGRSADTTAQGEPISLMTAEGKAKEGGPTTSQTTSADGLAPASASNLSANTLALKAAADKDYADSQAAKAAWEAAGSPKSGPEYDAVNAAVDKSIASLRTTQSAIDADQNPLPPDVSASGTTQSTPEQAGPPAPSPEAVAAGYNSPDGESVGS